MSKYKEQIEDFIGAGFKRLDPSIVAANPPRINWGDIYKRWPDDQKVRHLEKLASTMNHAAALIQDERNQLNELLEAKEKQIASMKEAIDQNNEMVHGQVLQMNEERQKVNEAFAALKAENRALKKQLEDVNE
jgi:flagellar capping protein FliD